MPDEKKFRELVSLSMTLVERGDFEGSIKVTNELIAYAPAAIPLFPMPLENRAGCYMQIIELGKNLPSRKQVRQWLLQSKDDLTTAIKHYKNMPVELYQNIHGKEKLSHCNYVLGEVELLLATTYRLE